MNSDSPTSADHPEGDKSRFEMSAEQRPIFVFVTAILAVVLLVGTGALMRQQRHLRLLRAQIYQLQLDMPAMETARDTAVHSLDAALQELDSLENELANVEDDRDPVREAEIQAWLARAKALKESFETKPAQKIPELRLLTDRDWLRVARTAEMDTPEHVRKAMADAREAAKHVFGSSLSDAVQKFTNAANGQLPATVFDLARWFDPPADMAMLQRYEVFRSANPGETAIREKAAVDEDYDVRLEIPATGGISTINPPFGWIDDFRGRMLRASQEYARANNGHMATGIADLAPFINPPLSASQLQKAIKAEKERQ